MKKIFFNFSLFTIHFSLKKVSARIKILAAVYILILAGIVVLADLRETQYLFRPIRQMPYGDKIGHFLLMGFFSLMLNLALKARTFRVWRINFLLGTLIVLVVVFIEECSQIFIRGRSFDYRDLIADFAGIIIFGELARLICRKFFKKEN
jgi:VanZ family protein